MNFISTQKFIIVSPRKLRVVADMVKDMSPEEAIVKLDFINKKGAFLIQKVIKTAVANAKQKGVDISKLTFKEIQIGEGPRLKRFRAGARGSAKPYKKRMSHIRVVLAAKPEMSSLKPKKQNNESKINKKVPGKKNV